MTHFHCLPNSEPAHWELSPLDLSIQEYEKRCKDYYYRKVKKHDETEAQREERLAELSEAKTLLTHEKQRLMTMISVEAQLQQYRDEFKSLKGSEKRRSYANEDHHPTAILAENLRKVGRAQPSPRFSAHHLVEGKGKLAITRQARVLLATYDIRINDPDNGVWMPMTEQDRGHWAMPKATPHSQIHTHNYERWIWGQIQYLESEEEIRAKLSILRAHLKNGTQPEQVTMKSDKSWDGRTLV